MRIKRNMNKVIWGRGGECMGHNEEKKDEKVKEEFWNK